MGKFVRVDLQCGSSLPAAPAFGEGSLPELSLTRAPPGLSADVLQQCIPWGILLVDPQRRILFANPRARSFLDAKSGLEERSGRVHVERANIDRCLGELVKRAAALSLTSLGADERIGVPDSQGYNRYALKVIPCRTEQGQAGALLIVTDLLSLVQVSREALAKIFHLSDREAEFAELFASGLRVDAIASRMAISVNTARVHLRHVLAKTGCVSQIELARTFAHMP
jgi:DNA-binding CsgD family transcriptional regulator